MISISAKMKLALILWMFSALFFCVHGSTTHWLVTEGGLIQSKPNSPFLMSKPHDLLAFLNQDTRWANIISLYHDLAKRQQTIDLLWSNIDHNSIETSLAEKKCYKADMFKIDWYKSWIADIKIDYINEKDLFLNYPSFVKDHDVPDCKKISSLTFSMLAFEHLEAMSYRYDLLADSEKSLPKQLAPIMTIEQFGHWVTGELKQNTTSWVHYNLASLFWRAKGNVLKAVECSRRAVHYSPRRFKDIPLQSLGVAFHRSKKLNDALTILGAAVDHNSTNPYNHFLFANALAVNGSFNESLEHYDECLKIDPNLKMDVEFYKNAVICSQYLFELLQTLKTYFDKLQVELSEYLLREKLWLKSQAAFLRTMDHTQDFDYSNVENNCKKMSEMTNLNIVHLKKSGDRNAVIHNFLHSRRYTIWNKHNVLNSVHTLISLQRFILDVEENSVKIKKIETEHLHFTESDIMSEIGPTPVFDNDAAENLNMLLKKNIKKISKQASDTNKSLENKKRKEKVLQDNMIDFAVGVELYPPTMKVNRHTQDFDINPDWPSEDFCKEKIDIFPKKVKAIFPVFLPFENKGINLGTLLSDKIGVPFTTEHDLPWHPPICPQDKDTAQYSGKKGSKPQITTEVYDGDHLRSILARVGAKGLGAELGHRIHRAMQLNAAPNWLLYTLASLYWRVRENKVNSLNCLLSASRIVKPKYRDIVMTSLASVYLEMGYFDEAVTAAEEALRINLYEPATNFLLAEVSMIKKHANTHIFHLKQVIRVEPNYMDGLARELLNAWVCLFHVTYNTLNIKEAEGKGMDEECARMEYGLNSVCDEDNSCQTASLKCQNQGPKGSALLKLSEQLNNHQHETSSEILITTFDKFIETRPVDPMDKKAHSLHLDSMILYMNSNLRGCGIRGCKSLKPDDLALKKEDCLNEDLTIGYWMYIVTFKLNLSDEVKFPPTIVTMSSTGRQVPECPFSNDSKDDFFIERMLQVDAEKWQPFVLLKHQLLEEFKVNDFNALGAKIANFVQLNPGSWKGMLAAGWWCGAAGKGNCAVRCLAETTRLAPPTHRTLPVRSLFSLLLMQSKADTKKMAHLAFYMSPKSKIEAILVAIIHTEQEEFDLAIWMYRYSLILDNRFQLAKIGFHTTICLILYEDVMSDMSDVKSVNT